MDTKRIGLPSFCFLRRRLRDVSERCRDVRPRARPTPGDSGEIVPGDNKLQGATWGADV